MKKSLIFSLIALLIVGGLLIVFLSGKGGEQAPQKKTLVIASRLWSPPNEQEFVINNVFKQFEEENNCIIDFSIVNDDDLLKKVEVQEKTNHVSTDIIIAYVSKFKEWYQKGFVEDLTPYVQKWTDRHFSKGFNKLTIFNGKQYFLPIGADDYLLIADKRALKYLPSGVDIQNITWEQVFEWAKAIAKGEGQGKFAWTGVPQKMFIYQIGSAILSYGGGFPDINSEAAKKVWKMLADAKDIFVPTIKTIDNVVAPMKRGEVWLTVTHNARVGQIYESNPTQYVVAPAPKGPAGIGSIAGTSGFAIVKGTQNKELAVKFLEFITRPDIMLKISKGTGGFIPPIDETMDLLGNSIQDEIIKKSLYVLQNGVLSFVPAADFKDWGAVKLVFDKVFEKMVLQNGQYDEAMLDEAAKELDALRK